MMWEELLPGMHVLITLCTCNIAIRFAHDYPVQDDPYQVWFPEFWMNSTIRKGVQLSP